MRHATRVSRKTKSPFIQADFVELLASPGPRRGCRGKRGRTRPPPPPARRARLGRDEGASRKTPTEPAAETERAMARLQWGPRRGCRGKPGDGERRDETIPATLQWGRRDEGVAENAQEYLDHEAQVPSELRSGPATRVLAENDIIELGEAPRSMLASMGPRRGCRGKRIRTGARWRRDGLTLQWGRDEGVAENPPARAPQAAPGPSRLQWGRDEGVAENTRDTGYAPAGSRPVLRMGAATRVSRENQVAGGTDNGDYNSSASMGPRRGCRGKPSGSPVICLPFGHDRVEWGRDEGVAENPCAEPTSGYGRWPASDWGRDEGVAEKGPLGMRTVGRSARTGLSGPRRGCRGNVPATARQPGRCRRAFQSGPRRGCRGKRWIVGLRRPQSRLPRFNGGRDEWCSRKTQSAMRRSTDRT